MGEATPLLFLLLLLMQSWMLQTCDNIGKKTKTRGDGDSSGGDDGPVRLATTQDG